MRRTTLSPPSPYRHWVMSRIRSQDTRPELVVRAALHKAGFRFRLGSKILPGNPDIILPKHKTAVFIHGCFWHFHSRCKIAKIPKSNRAFWIRKFTRNKERDKRKSRELRRLGWKAITVWECQITRDPESIVKKIIKNMKGVNADDIIVLPTRRQLWSRARYKSIRELDKKAPKPEKLKKMKCEG
jgi:DNA mismatch endonuclease (patch repair protein)